ncbi:shikimate kinase [Paraburkholderia caribensis]|uniref:shikimate kinase n=1 Tax=Paraburkholderia caribensis TaxID=75105 RepID=UPI0034D38E19
MIGSGKALFGQMLANALGYPHLELNAIVASMAKCSLKEMHALRGADAYARYVVRAVDRIIAQEESCIIASPAELVCNELAFSTLRGNSVVV